MRRRSASWQRWIASAAVVTVAGVVGCTASKPARVVEAAPAASRQAPAEAQAASSPAPAEIRSLDLREGAPEVFVDLEASAPLVWTSFRNAEGRVVVELPNAVPGARLTDLAPEEGLVSSLDIQKSEEGSRPITRLVIATRQEAEHSITAEGPRLRIQLMPVEDQGQAKLAFEPLGEETAAAAPPAATAAPPAAPAATGTPDRPAVAPAPAGVAATRLDGVEVLTADGGAVIRISGDGEFPYSTFALSEPRRFVIDLDGVINRSPRSSLTVVSGVVDRVRVAQFKPAPRPVSRVVFDLSRETVPTIERTSDALVVSFPAGMGAAPPAAPPASRAPAAQPSDLTLAQRTPGAIEAEEAAPMPAAQPSQVQVTPSRQPGRPVGSQPGAPPPSDTPVDVTPTAPSPASPLRSFETGTPGEKQRTYVGEPIDLKVTNADVTDVIRTFAQISGLNIIVQPGVHGEVTAELENVPWDQALEQVLKINGLDYELEGNVMRIAPSAVLRQEAQERQQLAAAKALAIPLRTVYQRLSYADANEVARLLKTGTSGMLSQRGSVVVDRRTNALIIKELPTNMDAVLSVVDLLDKPEPQVMIEARIIETTKRFTRELGIDWSFDAIADAAHGNTTGLVFPSNVNSTGDINLGGNANNAVLRVGLGNVLNTFTLDATLRAAENEGLVSILSAPKVATLNNRRASIQSGLQIPVQTVLNNTVTVQFINVTLRLDVVPQVTAEGTVLMDIDISKKEPATALLIPGATNAPIATKDARTQLLVRDGGTAVIGGIYKITGSYGDNRVPGLSNIPIIGHLFRNKTREEDNDELLIFITPRIIKL
ncbi:MAG TPA: type IV pilus secretin PilQ [Thermoanaerobaculia bacterium]|nr:type IV pilus secretin PilQ [Thermoanaerobaculia bacterium]